jgi:pilus assembly protein FimV
MRHKRILNLAIASALGLLAPVSAHAFGLGNINVDSALNEPFKASIPVTALKAGEVQNLQVRLASNEEFEKAGIERSFILSDFTFDIIKNSATDVVIKVTSSKSVREPLVDFLLTASSGNGRLIREYTVLLDPPTHVMAKPEIVSTVSSESVDDSDRQSSAVDQTAESKTNVITSQFNGSQYGVTTSTDTLWNIAKKVRPSSDVSMNQMMVALFNENKNAFKNQNINGLRTGYTINIPSVGAINSISKNEAYQTVRQHNEQWKNRNVSVTSPEPMVSDVVENSEQLVSTQSPLSDEQLTAQVVGNNADNFSESKLSLVTPAQGDEITDETSSELGDEAIQTISEQLTFAQETIEAQAQQNIEIESRMAAMEEQLETMRRLISLKDADLARLQSLLEEEQVDSTIEQQVETVVEAVVEGTQEITGELQAVIDDVNSAEQMEPESTAESLQNELQSTQDAAAIDTEVVKANKEQVNNSVVNSVLTMDEPNILVDTVSDLTGRDKKEVKDLIQQITHFTQKNKIPLSLAGILLLVILLLLLRRKKADDNEDESEPTIIVSPAVQTEQDETIKNSNIEKTETNKEQAPTKTAEDLIEQADVFVGYADYAQARTSLEQAHFIEPENKQAVSKLLFVLFKQQQTNKFIQLINDATVDSSFSDWQQIKEWGAKLAPTNELFTDADEIENQQVESEDVNEELTIELNDASEETVNSEQEESYIDFNADDYQVEQDVSIDDTSLELGEVQDELYEDSDTDKLEFEYSNANESVNSDISVEQSTSSSFSEDNLEQTNPESLSVDLELNDESETLELDKVDTTNELDLSLDIETASVDDDEYQLDMTSIEVNDTSTLSLDDSLTFEIDQLETGDTSKLEIGSTDNSDDLELNFDASNIAASESELEFDLDDFDEIDEAETKIDLAVAYIDMGDPEGAKSILDEVIADGNDEQKSRAQDLLASLA